MLWSCDKDQLREESSPTLADQQSFVSTATHRLDYSLAYKQTALAYPAAVRAALSQAASNEFNDLSNDVATSILAAGEREELSSTEQFGLSLLQNAIGDVITNFVNTLWNEAWCKEQCDNCGPALGVAPIIQNCVFTGISAAGSQFEFVERFRFLFDYNLDGIVDQIDPNVFQNFFPAGAINNNGPFNVRVDAFCDGDTEFAWPGGAQWALVNPNAAPPALGPSASSFQAPPLQGGYYYRPNTQLCFSATIITRGWTFNGWSANGGSPSSQSSGSTFCTSFSSQNPIPRNVNLNFSDPCSGATRTVSGPSFLICPSGYCN
jgi:hypothetical protein